MFECPTDHPALPKLFDPHIPNNPSLWAVFHGRLSGRALVDDAIHPTQCLLRSGCRLTYASQGMGQSFLAEGVDTLRQKGIVWLVRSTDDPPAPAEGRANPRLEFYDYDPLSPTLTTLRAQLPASFKIRLIDKNLLERCDWRDDMAFYCESLENFLLNGLGMCLMQDDEIIVEAYASSLGKPYAEIGAITHEPFRGRGYAPITVAYLMAALEQRGYHAYWSCDTDNLASARVARKLGFRVERAYEFLEYEAKNSL